MLKLVMDVIEIALCSIPSFKGKPKSRDIIDIKKEVEFLVNNGERNHLVSQDNCLYVLTITKNKLYLSY